MTLHTYKPQPMSLPSINFLHLTVSKIQNGQDFIGQENYGKVKSRPYDVADLQPLTNLPTKYQLPASYSFRDTVRIGFYRSRSLQQGQRSNQGHTMRLREHLHPQPMSPTIITSHTLTLMRYSLHKVLQVKVTTARSKVISRSEHDVAYLQPLTTVPSNYQLATPYSFRDIAQTRFSNSRTPRQGYTMTLHTYPL